MNDGRDEPPGVEPDADPDERTDVADRVVFSYPADLSEWGRSRLRERPFEAYLRRVHDTVRPGDRWEEFVGVGCCGNTLDVPLRVERVEGGPAVGPDTAIAYEEREACGLEGGWRVQSAAGPTT